MKNIAILSIALATSLYANTTQNDNLNHLFQSKFPVDDYIYKGGFAKPKEEQNDLVELCKKNKLLWSTTYLSVIHGAIRN